MRTGRCMKNFGEFGKRCVLKLLLLSAKTQKGINIPPEAL